MVIDAHQHFWKYSPQKQDWITHEMTAIQKDFMPSDLKKIYDIHKIDGCIGVQADQTKVETDFLIEQANQHNFIKGVVGWVDLRSEKVEDDLTYYKDHRIVKGFRHVVQDEPDPNFLLRKKFLAGISLLQKYQFTYDILVFPHHLGAVLEFVKQFPNQKFIIDHIAKPYIKDGFYDGWATLMAEIARHENVYCKLSGMPTEADCKTWTPKQIIPYMELVLETFGPDRILYGSDWPVCLLAGEYGKVKKLVTDFISKLSDNEQKNIMGNNAMVFYQLPTD